MGQSPLDSRPSKNIRFLNLNYTAVYVRVFCCRGVSLAVGRELGLLMRWKRNTLSGLCCLLCCSMASNPSKNPAVNTNIPHYFIAKYFLSAVICMSPYTLNYIKPLSVQSCYVHMHPLSQNAHVGTRLNEPSIQPLKNSGILNRS